MANPYLNEKKVQTVAAEARAGWAAPDPSTRSTPIDDGPISPWPTAAATMTKGGVTTAMGVLMVLLLGAAAFGWSQTEVYGASPKFPALAIVGIVVGLVCAIALAFRPMMAKYLAPIYALGEGVLVGAVSKAYEETYHGIVLQAVGATLGVFFVMLVLYRTGVIKVTDKFRRTIIFATLGLMVFYGISLLVNLFGGNIGFIHQGTPMGILFSVFAAGLASLNLALDFDMIDRGERDRWPKQMEWYCAFGVLVTLVWLYLELLRLLAKLQDRR